jgi:ABC-type nitrate/sulfonate/bicarbonate transport system permease component
VTERVSARVKAGDDCVSQTSQYIASGFVIAVVVGIMASVVVGVGIVNLLSPVRESNSPPPPFTCLA